MPAAPQAVLCRGQGRDATFLSERQDLARWQTNATNLQSVSRYIDHTGNTGAGLRPSRDNNQDLQTRGVLHGCLTVPSNPHASSLHHATRHTASLPCGARCPDVTREDSSKLDYAHVLVRTVSSCIVIR